MGLLQGITELFPISSLGHSVILPTLLGWQIDQSDPAFLDFVILTHFATALVLFLFFWKDWVRILRGIARTLIGRGARGVDAQLGWRLVAATIPAGLIGLLLQKRIEALFADPALIALVLIGNGVLLLIAERLRRIRARQEGELPAGRAAITGDARLAMMRWRDAILVGLSQCLALIPGFSRTGATLGGGLLAGLSHEDAARFSFLLATPIIGAAALLKLPGLALSGRQELAAPMIAGALAAALAAYLSVRFLTRYFKTKTLVPFGVYCIVTGIVAALAFMAYGA